jgi:multicomponent Na+:H+ antiporter subunit G
VILQLIAKILISAGVAFLLIGSVGVNRLPDFYCRTHAATKPDTLGLIFSLLGLALYDGLSLSSAKLVLIIVFVAMANPTATHALGRAALRSRLVPWLRSGKEANDG